LVVAFTFVAIVGALLVQFRSIIGPLLLAFILSYLLYPVVDRLHRVPRLTWRLCVNAIFLIAVILIVGLFTWAGIAAVQQAQNLIVLTTNFVNDLPQLVQDLASLQLALGPFVIDLGSTLAQFDLNALIDQLLGIVQPLLGRAGGVVSAVASATASTLGWGAFVLLVSYFILLDANLFVDRVDKFEIPGHHADTQRLARQLARIWNAFMRGQLFLFFLTVVVSFILMTGLGVRNALGLALLAGMARFIPYIGPFITWTVTALVAFFQPENYLGLSAGWYTATVVGGAVVLDQIFDNLITPRLYGQALGVHPAALLVAAIISANLIGLVGLLIAAPVLASLTLATRYAARKMFDLDPWPDPEPESAIEFPLLPTVKSTFNKLQTRMRSKKGKKDERTAADED
jgi:predicted PurR-regulated permease PerM